ncbi:MAG: autoinducer binding domain-containing protein [Nitrospirota bacterium]
MASRLKGTRSTPLASLAKRDLCELLGTIEASLAVNTIEELKTVIRRVTRLVPCDYAIATLSDCDSRGRPHGLSTIVNVSYPAPWTSLYLARGYAEIDPILQAHFQRPRTQVWSDTYRSAKLPRERDSSAPRAPLG